MEVPKAALSDKRLGASLKLLTALWGFAGRGRFVWPSVALLESQLSCTTRTVRRHIARLVETGWVVKEIRESDGKKGYCLCDPPGVIAHRSQAPLDGRHTRPEEADNVVQEADSSVQKEANSDMTDLAAETELSANPDETVRSILLGTNQELKGGSDLHGTGEPGANAQAPAPAHRVAFDAWRMEFAGLWATKLAEHRVRCGDPTRARHKLAGLRDALEEHGGDVVRDVLLHALDGVARHHQSNGRHGLHPGKLGVVFSPERPGAWEARLDAWQTAQGKLTRGRTPNPPVDLDGVRLTDEEQREWHLHRGGDHVEWLRDRRMQAAAEERRQEAAVAEFFASGVGGAA